MLTNLCSLLRICITIYIVLVTCLLAFTNLYAQSDSILVRLNSSYEDLTVFPSNNFRDSIKVVNNTFKIHRRYNSFFVTSKGLNYDKISFTNKTNSDKISLGNPIELTVKKKRNRLDITRSLRANIYIETDQESEIIIDDQVVATGPVLLNISQPFEVIIRNKTFSNDKIIKVKNNSALFQHIKSYRYPPIHLKWKTLLTPGLFQVYKEEKLLGYSMLISYGLGILTSSSLFIQKNNVNDELRRIQEVYDNSSNVEELIRLRQQVDSKNDENKQLTNYIYISSALIALPMLYNIYDSFLKKYPKRKKITFNPFIQSRTEALEYGISFKYTIQ